MTIEEAKLFEARYRENSERVQQEFILAVRAGNPPNVERVIELAKADEDAFKVSTYANILVGLIREGPENLRHYLESVVLTGRIDYDKL